MPVVVPLSEKPAEDECEHIAWEGLGRSGVNGKWAERRKCADCGYRWTTDIDPPEPESLAEGSDHKAPPPVAYAHAQIVTYKAGDKEFNVLIEETAIISVQNGVLVLQHPEGHIGGIMGVRPWLQEVTGNAPAAD